MDWTKAKNILIAAFLLTNLFLMVVLYGGQQGNSTSAISNDYVTQTLQFLQDKNIEIRTELPLAAPSLNSVNVEYRFFSPKEMAEKLLGNSLVQEDIHTYANHKGRVTVLEEKILIYQNKEQGRMLPSLEEEKLVAIANDFLRTHYLDQEGLQLEQIYFGVEPEYQEEPLHKLVYQQTYEGRFIGESYVNVFIGHRGIVAVEALLLENMRTIGETTTSHTMISAPEALLRTIEAIQRHHASQEPAVITEVLPGYFFPLTRETFAEGDSVESGTAVPAWKIVLKDGKTFYQEAF